MRITHLGHACLLVDLDGTRLLIDPGVFSDVSGVTDLTAILVTHQHGDHLDPAGVRELVTANPSAALVIDPDTAEAVVGLPEARVVRPGERLRLGGVVVDVLGGIHAPVWGPVPGCTNNAYLVGDGALLHPGDSFVVPHRDIDVLAVPIDAPWLKLSEAVDYVAEVAPRLAIPIHEGETTDPVKYAGMLAAFSADDVVRRLARGEATEV